MNNTHVARELVKLAKSLTAGNLRDSDIDKLLKSLDPDSGMEWKERDNSAKSRQRNEVRSMLEYWGELGMLDEFVK